MSWACGLSENGRSTLFPVKSFAIVGLIEDVAQVSKTISSGVASLPHFEHFFFVWSGSTGSSFSSANTIYLQFYFFD